MCKGSDTIIGGYVRGELIKSLVMCDRNETDDRSSLSCDTLKDQLSVP